MAAIPLDSARGHRRPRLPTRATETGGDPMDPVSILSFLGVTAVLLYVSTGSILGLLVVVPSVVVSAQWVGSLLNFLPFGHDTERPSRHELFATHRPTTTVTEVADRLDIAWLHNAAHTTAAWLQATDARMTLLANLGGAMILVSFVVVMWRFSTEELHKLSPRAMASLWIGIAFAAEAGHSVWPAVVITAIAYVALRVLLRICGGYEFGWRLDSAAFSVLLALVMFPFGLIYAAYA